MRWMKIAFTSMIVLLFPLLARADLISNGGFETGSFSSWTVGTNLLTFVGTSGTNYFGLTYLSHSGNNYAFLGDPTTSPMKSLAQSIVTTIGTTYQLGFWLGQDDVIPPPDNRFKVSADAVVLSDQSNIVDTGTYVYYSYNFTATNTSTLIRFEMYNTPGVFILDDVSVNAVTSVPVPAGMVNMGIGLVSFGLLFSFRYWRSRTQLA